MKKMSVYKLTFEDGLDQDQTFEGFLQFKNDVMEKKIVKAELIKEWEEEVVEAVADIVEADKVEDESVEVEVVEAQ